MLQNPHSLYLNAIAKAKEYENSLNYIDSPLISMQDAESGTRRSVNSQGKVPSQTSAQGEGRRSDSTLGEGRKSDPAQDVSPLFSMTSLGDYASDKMNQDELTPYSYFISIENPKTTSADILKYWKMKKSTRSLDLGLSNNTKIM